MLKAYALLFLGIAFIALCAALFELTTKLLFAKFRKETPPEKNRSSEKRKEWLN